MLPRRVTRLLAKSQFARLDRTLRRHQRQGDGAAVLATLSAMVALRCKHFGAEDPVAIATLNALGMTHRALGQLEEAEHCYERALAALRRQPKVDEVSQAAVQNNLGMAAMYGDKLETAHEHLSDAAAARERVLGLSDKNCQASLFALLEVQVRLALYDAAAVTLHKHMQGQGRAGSEPDQLALSGIALRLADGFNRDRDWPAAVGLYCLGAYVIYKHDVRVPPLSDHPVMLDSIAAEALGIAEGLQWDGYIEVAVELLARLCDVARGRAPKFEIKLLAALYDEARAARYLLSLDVNDLESMLAGARQAPAPGST